MSNSPQRPVPQAEPRPIADAVIAEYIHSISERHRRREASEDHAAAA